MARRQAVRVRTSRRGFARRLAEVLSVTWRPFVFWVLPAVVLIAACAIGLRASQSCVRHSPEYRITAPRIMAPSPTPPWWNKGVEDQINDSAAFAAGESILDDTILSRIADGYRKCPWVKTVRSVKKHFPNRIDVDLTLRTPAAAVACNTRQGILYCLVGDDGVRLPRVYAQWPMPGLRIPLITGARGAPGRPGEPWREASVAEAIQIVQFIRSSAAVSKAVSIKEVNVSNYHGRDDPAKSEFVLVAENNFVIWWGRAPGTDRPGELKVQDKLANFEQFLTADSPTSGKELDLRFPRYVSRRPGSDGDNS